MYKILSWIPKSDVKAEILFESLSQLTQSKMAKNPEEAGSPKNLREKKIANENFLSPDVVAAIWNILGYSVMECWWMMEQEAQIWTRSWIPQPASHQASLYLC